MFAKFIAFLIVLLNVISKTKGEIIVDPWLVQERYDLYMTILEKTRVPHLFGSDNFGNLLWGLPLQYQWQNRTGRLETFETPEGLRISEHSWWASINYYLSVIPYLSAMHKGLVPEVIIKRPPTSFRTGTERFCLTYLECPLDVMTKWDLYFEEVFKLQSGNCSIDLGNLLRVMWPAHTASIRYATEIFADQLELFNFREAQFGDGWARFVEVLDIVNFNTNYTQVSILSSQLPHRILTKWDLPPFIPNMSREMNNVAWSMISISDLNKVPLAWQGFLKLLRKIVRKPGCNEVILSQINNYVSNPVSSIIEVLGQLITFCQAR